MAWKIDYDDGVDNEEFKSLQLKAFSAAETEVADAPPAKIEVRRGE
jgi:hypothetical protein